MRQQRRFGIAVSTSAREIAIITAIMGDLRRVVEILESDVATEESRSRVFDRSDPAYPVLARSLAARRDNLKSTVAALGRRLKTLDPTAAHTAAA